MCHLLTINAGSSSVKFRLFEFKEKLPLVVCGKIVGIGVNPIFSVHKIGDDPEESKLARNCSQEGAVLHILKWLEKNKYTINAAAHRIVHGGEKYAEPVKLTPAVMKYLRDITPLAPLHQPHNLGAPDILMKHYPKLPQYGCFDTAFHAKHSDLFKEFALPEKLRKKGMKRYGFHGLSYDWIAHCLRQDFPRLAKGRVVVAHLGNGASLCAMNDGRSVDTTMGMTALDGLPMGTRCGALDAGAVLYMMQELGMSVDEVEKALYHESGLKGLSGLSSDVKVLLDSHDNQAAFTLEFFAMKTAQYIAAMAVSMEGLDGVIFTGGIGENAAPIREMILENLDFLSPFESHVIPTNEERSMANMIWKNFEKDILK